MKNTDFENEGKVMIEEGNPDSFFEDS